MDKKKMNRRYVLTIYLQEQEHTVAGWSVALMCMMTGLEAITELTLWWWFGEEDTA